MSKIHALVAWSNIAKRGVKTDISVVATVERNFSQVFLSVDALSDGVSIKILNGLRRQITMNRTIFDDRSRDVQTLHALLYDSIYF